MTVASAPSTAAALGELLGHGTRAITVATSRDPNAKLTMLLFPAGSSEPTLAVKVPTTPAAEAAVAREVAALRSIRPHVGADLRDELPAIVAMVPTPEGRALVTTALSGTPMITRYHRWRHVSRRRSVEADFRAAGTWLSRLHSATATRPQPVELLTEARSAILTRFSEEPALARVLAALDDVDGRLHREHAPCTVVHGDYWPGNLLVDDKAVVGVIDWEAAALHGQPLRDIARFALSYALYLDRHTRDGRQVAGHPGLRAGPWGAGIAYAIDGDGWFPRLVATWAGSHLDRLGVPAARWRDVALAGLAEIAATADDTDFARAHFELIARLTRAGSS